MYQYLNHIAQQLRIDHLSKEYVLKGIERKGFYVADVRNDKYLIKPKPGFKWEVVRETGLPVEAALIIEDFDPEEESFSYFCRRNGISRATAYNWRARLIEHGFIKGSVKKTVKTEAKPIEKENDMNFLYTITDIRTNSVIYIGITNNFERRREQHFNECVHGDYAKPLYKLFAQQGVENYTIEVRAQDEDREFIEKMERQLITHTPGLYNVQYNR